VRAALGALPHTSNARLDAQTIRFRHQSFDAVIANHTLYAVPNRMRATTENRRVLKPAAKIPA
jgi:ubiquinone/menaquinone biosynthesis C-methylase UbiE